MFSITGHVLDIPACARPVSMVGETDGRLGQSPPDTCDLAVAQMRVKGIWRHADPRDPRDPGAGLRVVIGLQFGEMHQNK